MSSVQLSVADRETAEAMLRAVAPVSGFKAELTHAMLERDALNPKWTLKDVTAELVEQLRKQFPDDHNLTTLAAMARQVKRLDMVYNCLTSRAEDDAYWVECGKQVGFQPILIQSTGMMASEGAMWGSFLLTKSSADWIEERDRLKDIYTTIVTLAATYAQQVRAFRTKHGL